MAAIRLYIGSKGWNDYFVSSFFYILFSALFLMNINLNAKTTPKDSLKIVYPKSDPRNPDCPCHKYQKLAEREFKRESRIGKNIVLQNHVLHSQNKIHRKAVSAHFYKTNKLFHLRIQKFKHKKPLTPRRFKLFFFKNNDACPKF